MPGPISQTGWLSSSRRQWALLYFESSSNWRVLARWWTPVTSSDLRACGPAIPNRETSYSRCRKRRRNKPPVVPCRERWEGTSWIWGLKPWFCMIHGMRVQIHNSRSWVLTGLLGLRWPRLADGDWNMLTQALWCLADKCRCWLRNFRRKWFDNKNHEFSSVIGKKPYYKLQSIKNTHTHTQFSYWRWYVVASWLQWRFPVFLIPAQCRILK